MTMPDILILDGALPEGEEGTLARLRRLVTTSASGPAESHVSSPLRPSRSVERGYVGPSRKEEPIIAPDI